MTIKGLVVHFRRDSDDHEAERTIDALVMIKGVSKVSPIAVGYEDDVNRQRVKRELRDKLLSLLDDE
ncbi:hypothetical protein [Sorangium atrum]|uniref:Uncharacterized protein n=1 Tax=Sorangium atrum TaxID=2995308 RepID=A0ABT5BZH8_9BACT|nr:hypothetical protein [Sorangium aterium]MDC0679015.1 hypothetical protein [Sorangium aterium]